MIVNILFQGLKCDNPICGFHDMNISFEEYPDHIDERCPFCGIRLLTQECYDECLNIMDMVKHGRVSYAFESFPELPYLGRTEEELAIINKNK